uniref:Nuclear receptor n=1 Tax=Heterorhabditis bacteriophora TaxID=37862 RepID=A0A1I7X9G6_HETBA
MEERLCRVCADLSDGAHFGIDSCRACAAFFRRSVVMRKRYPGVQNRRDPIIPRRSEPDSISIASLHLDGPSESGLTQDPFAGGIQSDNSQSSSVKPQDLPLFLYNINDSYKKLCAERKRTELSMNVSSLKEIFEPPAIWQWIIFHSFVITLWGMDSAYRTYKMIPPEQCNTKKIITETTYIDLDNIDAFFSDGPTSKLSKEHLTNLMRNCIKRTQTSVIDKMRELQITDEEFAALLSLSLWNTNLSNGNEKIETIAKRMRAKIFHELHLLYRYVSSIAYVKSEIYFHFRYENLDEYAGRLGELMILLCSVQYDVSRMKEDMELFNLLDVFSRDSFLYDIIKG